MDRIIDKYFIISMIIIYCSIINFKQFRFASFYGIRINGYLALGIAGLVSAFGILLVKLSEISIGAIFLISGFIIITVGYGILMTKERHIEEAIRKNTNIFQRLLGIIPPEAIRVIKQKPEAIRVIKQKEDANKMQKVDGKWSIYAGIFSIIAGIIIFVWKNEVVYPVFLIIGGCIYIFMGKFYSKK